MQGLWVVMRGCLCLGDEWLAPLPVDNLRSGHKVSLVHLVLRDKKDRAKESRSQSTRTDLTLEMGLCFLTAHWKAIIQHTCALLFRERALRSLCLS